MKAKKREAAFGLRFSGWNVRRADAERGERASDRQRWQGKELANKRAFQRRSKRSLERLPNRAGRRGQRGGAEECFENHLARKRDEISAGDEARETSS